MIKVPSNENRVEPVDGFHVVIPARYESTRLPGKPLADIGGKPMIVWVAEAAVAAGALDVTVATDSEQVASEVSGAGFDVALTRADHTSGSDRVFEVVASRGWSDADVVLNVQGDEPLIPPALIRQVGEFLIAQANISVCTLREPILNEADMSDPNCVKVVVDHNDRALLFSRAYLPHRRDGFDRMAEMGNFGWRHVGLYGYRVAALRDFVALPPSPLEKQESLEQLRLLENGIDLTVLEASEAAPGGVDTAEDLARVRRLLD